MEVYNHNFCDYTDTSNRLNNKTPPYAYMELYESFGAMKVYQSVSPMLGKYLADENKMRLFIANMDRYYSEETKRKLSKAMKEKTRKKLSEALYQYGSSSSS
jgi:hypothetical protein